MLRSGLTFLASVGLYFTSLRWIGPFVDRDLTRWTATVTAWMLRFLGVEARAKGALVTSELISFQVIGECTAIHPAAFFLAAVAAYPAGLRSKLWGAGLGLLSIVFINQCRMLSLCYVGSRFPEALATMHLLVWQSLMMVAIIGLWLGWAAVFASRDAR